MKECGRMCAFFRQWDVCLSEMPGEHFVPQPEGTSTTNWAVSALADLDEELEMDFGSQSYTCVDYHYIANIYKQRPAPIAAISFPSTPQ